MPFLKTIPIAILLCLAAGPASAFTVRECVLRLTRNVDPPYRLTVARATIRCNAIARRIGILSGQIVGRWQRRDEDGRLQSLTFLEGGVARSRFYSHQSNRNESETRRWAFENPYGTLGAEVLDFYPYLVGVRFSAGTMIVEHQPTSSQNAWVERWTRAR